MRRSLVARLWGPGGVRLLFGDAAVLGILVVGTGALVVKSPGERPAHAEVEAAGSPVATIDIRRDGVSDIKGPLGTTRVEVQGGRVRILASPCPQQTCRHRGWIGSPGEMLVCLPNQMVVRIPGRQSDAPDAVAR